MMTYNDERGIIVSVFAVDVNALRDQFLTPLQITAATCHQKIVEFWRCVEGVLISQDSSLNKLVVVFELSLKLELSEHHGLSIFSVQFICEGIL